MALTITNTNTLQLLNILNQTQAEQSNTLTKLTTGYRINKGADDPAGLIAVQNLSAELTAVDAAIASGQRANSFLGVADGAFKEVNNLLIEIEGLVARSTNTAGLTQSEIAANQAQIDQAVASIDRIVGSTAFNGKKLLDGTQGLRTTRDATAETDVSDVRIYSRTPGTNNVTLALSAVTAAARTSAVVAASDASFSAASFTIQGKLGTATITVVSGDTAASIRDKIVAVAGTTGVSARLSGQTVKGVTRDFGTEAFISVTGISGDTDVTDVTKQSGVDAVVAVNGQRFTGDGLKVTFNATGVSGEFTLTTTGNAVGTAGTVTVGGNSGATFQLGTDSNSRINIGIDSLFTGKLGNTATGYLSEVTTNGKNDLSTNANNALSIVREAISQVATAQGRIGATQRLTVDSTVNSLNATKKSLEEARSAIRDIDYATETANLNRQNVLLQSAVSLLGVAGQQTSQILSLLR